MASLDLALNEKRSKRFLALLPAGARASDASVSINGDALLIDDRRWVRASLRDEVRVLLVDGDPRTVRHDDELFYVEAALRPGDREDFGHADPPDHVGGARGHRSQDEGDLGERSS
ncbi:MAG: hypothetical protein IPQ07_06140 [Myxococcales bacterium]|nr:hypothetical protein [Myxococcales bacterium]